MVRKVNRRSFLHRVTGGALVGGSLGLVSVAQAQTTDRDTGATCDQPGCGPRRTGITDRDAGANADPVNRGRGVSRTGFNDSDRGDPSGGGRTGVTDSDRRDRTGYGRAQNCRPGQPPRSDPDFGQRADPLVPCRMIRRPDRRR